MFGNLKSTRCPSFLCKNLTRLFLEVKRVLTSRITASANSAVTKGPCRRSARWRKTQGTTEWLAWSGDVIFSLFGPAVEMTLASGSPLRYYPNNYCKFSATGNSGQRRQSAHEAKRE